MREFSLLITVEGNVSGPFLSALCPELNHGCTVRGGHPTPE